MEKTKKEIKNAFVKKLFFWPRDSAGNIDKNVCAFFSLEKICESLHVLIPFDISINCANYS